MQRKQQTNSANANGKWNSGRLGRQSRTETTVRGKTGRSLEAYKHADEQVKQEDDRLLQAVMALDFKLDSEDGVHTKQSDESC